MQEVKDTVRALVRIGYDGRVHKTFRGHQARERFENEVRVLKHLETTGSPWFAMVDLEPCQSVPMDQICSMDQQRCFCNLLIHA